MKLRRSHVLVAVATLVLSAVQVIVHLESRDFMDTSVVVFGVGLTGGGILVLVGGVLALLRRTAWPLVIGVLLLVSSFGSGFAAGRIAAMQLPGAKETGRPLAAALERYIADRGKAPAELDDLATEYLKAIPRCPLGVTGREYRYWSREGDWGLWFPTISGTRQVWNRDEDRWEYRD